MNDLVRRLVKPGAFADLAEERKIAQADNWEQAMRIARMHSDVFSSEAGQRLIDHWVQVFVARPIVRPRDDAYAQGIREGQADVVRQLLVQLEIARTGPGGSNG